MDNQVRPETEMATLLQVVSDLTRSMRVLEKRLATVEAQKEELKKLTKVHEPTDKETDSYASDTHSNETSPSRRVTLSSGGHSSSSDSEDGFSFQRRQRRKQRRKLQQADPSVKLQVKVNTLKADPSAQTQCRPTNTGVTVKNGRSLKSAIKTLDKGHKEIYIGGVDSENSADDVRDHLHKIGVRDAVVTELANRPNWKSYKAVVRDNVEKTALNNRHWSPGITVRPFRKQELSQKEREQKGHLLRKLGSVKLDQLKHL